MSKKRVQLKLKAYDVVTDAIERGIRMGWNHAHKHTDTPSEDVILEHIHNDVMNELSELIDWDQSG